MIIVSNTSPIWNLWTIEHLHLLKMLFGKITIPQAVYIELKRGGIPPAVFHDLSWISVQTIENVVQCQFLQNELDIGEAESIVLAHELNASLLLIDEKRGRKVAHRMKLRISSLLGVLTESKRRNLIPNVKSIMDRLLLQSGFWIDNELYKRVLQDVKES